MAKTLNVMNAELLKTMEKAGYKLYGGHSECFFDAITSMQILIREGIVPYSPSIIGTPMGDTDVLFWSKQSLSEISDILRDNGGDATYRLWASLAVCVNKKEEAEKEKEYANIPIGAYGDEYVAECNYCEETTAGKMYNNGEECAFACNKCIADDAEFMKELKSYNDKE